MNTLKEKLDKEMDEFKKTYENMTPTQIYNDWYIIMFYESYYEFLTYLIENEYSGYYSEDILEWLNTYENPLGFLYSEWLSCDGAFCGLWDDMIAWLQDLKCDVEENSYEEEYYPSSTNGDYSPSNPWDAPGMSIRDFI